jgi:hypothetical protein
MEASRSRAERFCSAEPVRLVTIPTNNSFGDPRKWGSKFILQWIDRNEAIALAYPRRWSEILEHAIQGSLLDVTQNKS